MDSAWRRLVQTYGEERVATAILAKWMSDPEAGPKWELLEATIGLAERGILTTPNIRRRNFGNTLTLKRRVLLWHIANGHSLEQAAWLTGIGVQTAKTQWKAIKRAMGLQGETRERIVAEAIRRGIIP